MNYKPLTCVWEVTMGCNMNCGHCGSSCNKPLPDELNTEEAFKFVDMCKNIGLEWITLSGGEPLIRKDLFLIIKKFSENNILANIITNGWLLTEETAKNLKNSGVSTVAISLDGTENIHDKIRKPGSFKRILTAFENLKKHDIYIGSVTTVTNKNIDILEEIKEILIKSGVDLWQLQIGIPMGNFLNHTDWLIPPEKIKYLINFTYDNILNEKRIDLHAADCIGYCSEKELETFNKINNPYRFSLWHGCNAGIRSFGMLHNGDILGCTSIRDKSFIEGNIKEKTLREIWESPDTFLWRRNLIPEKLGGRCKSCDYCETCLGGCPNTRLTINKSIYSENQYCWHNL